MRVARVHVCNALVPWLSVAPTQVGLRTHAAAISRKWTNGVSTNKVTAAFMFFDRGTFWVLPLTYLLILPKVPGRTFLPNLSKFMTSAAAPLVSTPFVRSQAKASCASSKVMRQFPCSNRGLMLIPISACYGGMGICAAPSRLGWGGYFQGESLV